MPEAKLLVRPPTAPQLRDGRLGDLGDLLRLEERCFSSDRLSRRSFQHLLSRGHAITLVARLGARLAGYAVVLLHGSTSLARLYSLAVDPDLRGQGIGQALLAEAERRSLAAARAVLRLEVRKDNRAARRIYRAAGYRQLAEVPDYYEDHEPALRLEKRLAGGARPELERVPYYAQTLEFTCGPACLLMALRALDPTQELSRQRELRLWREATLIFMTSGHGGCDAHGLAVAARRRGFATEVFTSHRGAPFLETVRSEEKKEAIRLVHQDLLAQARELGLPLHQRSLRAREMAEIARAGGIPIVLISSWRIYGEKNPHWVVITGVDGSFLYIHDPFVDTEKGKSATDCMNVPVTYSEFDRMARFGARRMRSAVILTGKRL